MPPISKESVRHLQLGEEHAGQRLDNYLIKILKGVPRSHIWRIIRAGEVRINGKRVKAETRLHAGDSIRIPPIRTAERALPAPTVPPRLF
uniref:S4 domain-containing protein n=1 Tax=Conchiformibius steedae TaxID=153493 RepID=UPI0026F04C96